MANVVNWFEIPAADIDRAAKFYEAVLGSPLEKWEITGIKMAMLPMQGEGVGGALCQGDWYKPSASDGPIIYLNGGDDLALPLSKVEGAGGKVTMPKTLIRDDVGYMGFFIDSEGNRVAFHSRG